jgi:hypothetical protein
MVNINLILYKKGFFDSVLMSPTQMGSLSINNSSQISHAWAPLRKQVLLRKGEILAVETLPVPKIPTKDCWRNPGHFGNLNLVPLLHQSEKPNPDPHPDLHLIKNQNPDPHPDLHQREINILYNLYNLWKIH